MDLPQVSPQEAIGPAGRLVAEVPGVTVDHRSDERVNDSQGRRGTSGARGIRQAGDQVETAALLEALRPVVNGTAADAQYLGDLLRGLACCQPQQGLETAILLGEEALSQKVSQTFAFLVAELQKSHGCTDAMELVDPRGIVSVQELFAAYLVVRGHRHSGRSAPVNVT